MPLLITAILAAGLVVFLVFTYATLARRSEEMIRDRIAHAGGAIAGEMATAIRERTTSFATVARDPMITRALAGVRADGRLAAADSLAAVRALRTLIGGRDSLAVMLTDAQGRALASAGNPIPPSVPAIDPRSVVPPNADDARGAARVSALIPVGDQTLFWLVAPVVSDNRRLGYIVEPRWLLGAPAGLQYIRELTREDLAVYARNLDGTGWNYATGRPVMPPVSRESTTMGLTYERPGAGRFIVEEAQVAGTPWILVLDSPARSLHTKLATTVESLAWMSLALLVAGAGLAWTIGRRITRPLVALTGAADDLASGTYARPLVIARGDEVGRLAVRFDSMARQVTEARRELEQRATDAQRVADELAAANGRLHVAMEEAETARAEAERARGEAEAANRAKSDFLAMMSHELRTPLNAIAGYAELLEMGIHGPVTDAQRDALNRIARSQAHLLTLINDVLNFARVDSGRIRYVVQDLRMTDTLAGLEPLVAPQMAARRLTFTYEACDPVIVAAADGDKVRQVVLNLLSNAVKYTPEGGAVRLTCDADATTVRVHVHDTGPGIDADQLPVIFEPFVQGNRALNRPNEGVGLGLAISRDLARGMGGDVTVRTILGAGSTFTLELPRVQAAEGEGVLSGGDSRGEARTSAHVA